MNYEWIQVTVALLRKSFPGFTQLPGIWAGKRGTAWYAIALLCIFSPGLVAVTGCLNPTSRESPEDRTAQPLRGSPPMYIDVDGLRFYVPPGFEDVTGYSFKTEDRRGRLEVSFDRLPAGVEDVKSLAAHRRRRLTDALSPRITGTRSSTLAGFPAEMFTFEFEDGGVTYRERWTMAMDTEGSYISLADTVRKGDADAIRAMDSALKSASLVEKTAPPQKGFVRRWAGRLWLDVPVFLHPPRTYWVYTPDEALRIDIANHGEATPSLEEEIAIDTRLHETITSRETVAESARVGQTTVHILRLRRVEFDQITDEVVLHAHIHVGPSSNVHITARGPATKERQLREAVSQLLRNAAPANGR